MLSSSQLLAMKDTGNINYPARTLALQNW